MWPAGSQLCAVTAVPKAVDMPVMRVQGPGGRVGYRWGTSGKVYTGPGAKEKAQRQGRAASASGYRAKR